MEHTSGRECVRAGAEPCPASAPAVLLAAELDRLPPPGWGPPARRPDWLAVRADLLGDPPPAWLRPRWAPRLIYALRTSLSGGTADAFDGRRPGRLRAAAEVFDLVELEAPHDLVPEVLEAVPAVRRLICWDGPAQGLAALRSWLRELTDVGAAVYRLTIEAGRAADGLPPLELLREAGRADLIAFARGEPGAWTRVLSAHLGAPIVFGSLDGEGPPGGPSIARLAEDFGLPEVRPVRRIFGVAGSPVAHSLSPRLHNAAYRALGIPALFLPFTVDDFSPFWAALVTEGGLERLGFSAGGLTVSSPNKEAALRVASAVCPTSRRCGSANLSRRRRGLWVAETTDPAGVTETLAARGISVAGRRVAVVGCGGSGRAIAAALARTGARVALSNRGRERGEQASRRLGLPLVDLSSFEPESFDLIVNATPVGREDDETPFAAGRIAAGAVVVDLVYSRRGPTALVRAARSRGATVIDGGEVLQVQAGRQFARMTGRSMPARRETSGLRRDDPAPPPAPKEAGARRPSLPIRPGLNGLPLGVER